MSKAILMAALMAVATVGPGCTSAGGSQSGGSSSGDGSSVGGGSGSGSTTGGATGSGSALATGEGPCEAASDCNGGICVALIDGNNPPVYCTQDCGGCPNGFYCDSQTFGLVGLEFCRFGTTAPTEIATPDEPPRLPCRTDADCEGEAVCATYGGQRDCTISCAAEPDCTPPTLGGVTIDLATCAPDETAGEDRTVCLPDAACFPNALSCISGVPGLPGLP